MGTPIYALGHVNSVCCICSEEDCAHLDGKPRCKHCGRRKKDHAGDDHKCLFEATMYEPFRSVSIIDDWSVDRNKDNRYLPVKQKPHKTRGGVGVVGRLRRTK
jgi:hypothetical protein